MNRIKKLDSGLINKIAAGEVVDRPVSVVKELTENAIDAGASQITIEIKEGGIAYIRVTDNGSGISPDQVKTAFLRHATSKITSLSELEQVMTLGFRGEALSSIAAVAQVEMITKTPRAFTGCGIEIHDGVVIKQQEAGCPEGTTVVVRNLFYHTPARYKFLKKPAAEGGYISDMVSKLAMGHPDIAFTYVNNSAVLLQTNGNGDLKTAIFQVYGKEIAKKMILIAYKKDSYDLTGFIGQPEIARGNRVYENFFLNGRFVKSDLVRSAVEDAYKTKLPIGRFPIFVLNLKADPGAVDVNVHPTKLEVRFSQEELFFQLIREAVDSALREHNLIPEMRAVSPKYSRIANTKITEAYEQQDSLIHTAPKERKPLQVAESPEPGNSVKRIIETSLLEAPAIPSVETARTAASVKPIAELTGIVASTKPVVETPRITASTEPPIAVTPFITPAVKPITETHVLTALEKTVVEGPETSGKMAPLFNQYKIIGQVFQTYWIIEQGESLFFIDQHAAHERIIYEELVALYKKKEVPSQRLLQPVISHLSHREKQLVEDHKALLESFGFELEEFGEAAYVLRSVPFIFNGPVAPDFLLEIIDKLSGLSADINSLYETRLSTIAGISCKTAVKANDRLSHAEARACIEKLLTLEEPFTCPHGRPTIIEMTKQEMERRFKR